MSTQTVTTTTAPWSAQADKLKFGFDEAKKLYQQGAPGYFPGNTIAGFTQGQQNALNQLGDFQYGSQQAINQTGQQLAGQTTAGLNALNSVAGGAAPQAQMMSQQQLQGYAPMLNDMAGAATFAAQRNLQENIMPGIANAAAGSGNLGSSRRAVSEGIAQRGLAENYQNAYAQAQNNLFNQGNAMNLANANMQMQNNQLAANVGNQLVNFGVKGTGLQQQADELSRQALNTQLSAGTMQQQQNQLGIDADRERYNYEQNADRQMLADYLSMIQGNYGSSSSQTMPTASTSDKALALGANVLGGVAASGGLNKAFDWIGGKLFG